MKAIAFALASLIIGAAGLGGGLRADERDLETTNSVDCSQILQWKLYYPGDVTYWPVPEKEVPGNMRRIKNGTCIKVSETEDFNIMMYTVDWRSTCVNQPECGTLKLYNIDTQTIIKRSGKEVVWPFFLYGDKPCYDDGHIDDACNPSDVIFNADAADRPLAPGNYYLQGETWGSCALGEGPPSDQKDSDRIYFTVKNKC